MFGKRSGSAPPVRLVVASGDAAAARRTGRSLDRVEDIRVVATTASPERLIRLLRTEECDVVLVDRELADDGAAELPRVLRDREGVDSRLVVSGVEASEGPILHYLQVGYVGFVPRGAGLEELAAVARAVARDELPVGARVSFAMARRVGELARICAQEGLDLSLLSRLTKREREVLWLIARGRTNSEIGERLAIAESTVKSHVHNILRKLCVQSRHQAARFALDG